MTEKLDWFRPEMGPEEVTAVTKVLESNYVNDGAVTREFEKLFSQFVKTDFALAVTSGTTAISIALMALDIGSGDEVIVPDFTFVATANAVRMTGADVRLVDVNLDTFCIEVERVREAITCRTKAVIAVDVNGRSPDYGKLEALCNEYGLRLICDSAEALGSNHAGRPLGTFGDAGCFSFSAAKTISSGQGGMIVCNEKTTYHRMKELKDQGRRETGTGGDDLHPVIGYNFKYTDLQAAVAIAQFGRLHSRLAQAERRDIWYTNHLMNIDDLSLPSLETGIGQYRQWTDVLLNQREAVVNNLNHHNIESRPFWLPLHRQQPYRDDDYNFPNSVKISQTGLWLPSSFDLTELDVIRLSAVLRNASP